MIQFEIRNQEYPRDYIARLYLNQRKDRFMRFSSVTLVFVDVKKQEFAKNTS